MKAKLLILILLLFSAAGMAANPQTAKKPLTKDQVMGLVKGSVPSTRVAELVRDNGIDFEPTEDYFRALRAAGAGQVVIDALRASSPKAVTQEAKARAKQQIVAANALMATGDIDGAIALYQKALQENASDSEAQAFCQWAGGRLPSEAEWEYAARAGSLRPLYGPLDEIAWYAGNSNTSGRGPAPQPGGRLRPNAFKLYDMLGNVREWTNDWFDKDYYAESPREDPPGPASGRERVARGRAWAAFAGDMRVSFRGRNPPDGSYDDNGFRCVCNALRP